MPGLIERLSSALGGRYAIERELGAGGMATVYLAHDAKHDRRVAVKVLHPDLAAAVGAERFLAEIRTTANLQHPHILPLHDSGEVDGLLYYVMPFVDGESLRVRLTREKQLPIEEALRISREVADALSYAHSRGVLHRDIKPENILLHGVHALVADFGIALAVDQAGGERLTHTGVSIGTPQYMAPEQAMGERRIDHRVDIYALGAVTYEMLTGEPPFTGASLQTIVAKLMTERPIPPSTLRDTVPPTVERAVLKALSKLPADRFVTGSEFAAALQIDRQHDSSFAVASGRTGWPFEQRKVAVILAFAAIAIAAVSLSAGWQLARRTASTPPTPPSRLSLPVTALRTFAGGGGSTGRNLVLVPDGSAIAYMAAPAGQNQLLLHRLDAVAPVRLQLGEGGPLTISQRQFVVALSNDGRLMRIPLDGGAPIVGALYGLNANAYVSAHPDGSIWGTRSPYTTLDRMGGKSLDSVEARFSGLPNLRLLQVLGDGRTALLVQLKADSSIGQCVAMDLQTGDRIAVPEISRVRDVRYTAGYLVYVTDSNALNAVSFDTRTRRVTGRPAQIARNVAPGGPGIAQFAASENGTVAYIPADPPSLVYVDRKGTSRLAFPEVGLYHGPRFSRDGRRIALDMVGSRGRDLWLLSVDDTTLTPLTFHRTAHDPTWTPDGNYLTYGVLPDTNYTFYRVRAAAGATPESLFTTATAAAFTGMWLPDASALVTAIGRASGDDIAILRGGGHGPLEKLVATRFLETAPAVSSDGRWLAFVANYSGENQVYVRGLGADPTQLQVSQGHADEPVWSRDGRELFYRRYTGDGSELVVAQIETTPTLRVRERRSLFSTSSIVPSVPHANYDVSPDGSTFVMVRRNPASHIIIIQNVPELVRRLQRQ